MCGVPPLVMRSDAVSINIWGESYCCYSSYVMNWSPHRVRGDTKEAPPPLLFYLFSNRPTGWRWLVDFCVGIVWFYYNVVGLKAIYEEKNQNLLFFK